MLAIEFSDVYKRMRRVYYKKRQNWRQKSSNLVIKAQRKLSNLSKNKSKNIPEIIQQPVVQLGNARADACLNNADWDWLNSQGKAVESSQKKH